MPETYFEEREKKFYLGLFQVFKFLFQKFYVFFWSWWQYYNIFHWIRGCMNTFTSVWVLMGHEKSCLKSEPFLTNFPEDKTFFHKHFQKFHCILDFIVIPNIDLNILPKAKVKMLKIQTIRNQSPLVMLQDQIYLKFFHLAVINTSETIPKNGSRKICNK